MPETREQTIERMAQGDTFDAFVRSFNGDEAGDLDLAFALDGAFGLVMRGGNDARAVFGKACAVMLPVAVKAVTDRVRDAIDEVVFDLSFDDRTRVVAVDDLLPALDRIDAELGGER